VPAGIAPGMPCRLCENDGFMKPFLIGVAGLSGSGKTSLARHLAQALHAPSEIITLDSYYHPQAHLSLAERAHLNFDHPDALDWELLCRHLDALVAGEAVEEPHYLFDQHTRAAQTRRVEPRPFLILEGILTLHRPEIRALLNLKVFVTTQPEECLRRRMERDIAERGRTRESVVQQYSATVWPMAQRYVIPSSGFADVIVSGQEPFDQSVPTVLGCLHRAFAAVG
jgi:uridine kinase